MTALLDSEGVAEKLGCSRSYAQKMISARVLPVVRIGQKMVKVREEDLEAWIASQVERPVNERRARRHGA